MQNLKANVEDDNDEYYYRQDSARSSEIFNFCFPSCQYKRLVLLTEQLT